MVQNRSRLTFAVAAAVMLAAAPVAAQGGGQPSYSVTAPKSDGWKMHDWLGANLANELKASELFGKQPIESGSDAYAKVGVGGIYITWARTKSAPEGDAGPLLRKALDKLRGGQQAASMKMGATEEILYREQIADRVVITEHVWKHNENSTISMSKTLLWVETSGQASLVRGECVIQMTGDKAVETLCKKTLASLRVNGAKATRNELPQIAAAPPTGEQPTAPPALPAAPSTDPDPSKAVSKTPTEAPSMQPASGDSTVLYEKDPETSNKSRGLFLVAGALLIIAAFWFTSKARSRNEVDTEADSGDSTDDDELEADLVDSDTRDADGEEE